MSMYPDISLDQIDAVLQRSQQAFDGYRLRPVSDRAKLLRAIASELEEMGDEWIEVAHRETNLPAARLRNERSRTIHQLESYALATVEGDWMRISIDTALPDRNPPRPDLRKTMIPLGPVVVFGASNFPYAYSTAGGDTASALAAGCSVIVKAHPAHPETSFLAAGAIRRALETCALPIDLVQHVYGASFEVGRALVQHANTAAVGFTGSYTGGKQLFDWANQRPRPIPVFAEMGSVNPIFLLPEILEAEAESLAEKIAASVTLGVGQFCTNPGLLFALDGDGFKRFRTRLHASLQSVSPAPMLHAGIQQAYQIKTAAWRSKAGVSTLLAATDQPNLAATAQCTEVSLNQFLSDPSLHQEVFGPATLLVVCDSPAELLAAAQSLEGQLTCSVFGTEAELLAHEALLSTLQLRCGRFNFNMVPTGVEVTQSMQHGGPFPATTDPRFSAVGSDSILRFVRPISYQNCPDRLLPEELKTSNPLQLRRKVDGQWRQ